MNELYKNCNKLYQDKYGMSNVIDNVYRSVVTDYK